jgi:small subunit ribosomal protein S16
LRIRLTRVGKKKRPAYRIVVADSHSPRDGAFLKIIGHYDPLTDPATLVVKEEQAVHWLQKGAQPSEAAGKLLTRAGVMEKAGKPPITHKVKATAAKSEKEAPKEAAAPAPQAEAPTAEAEAPAAEAEAPAAEAETSETPPEEAAPKAKATKGKSKQEPEPTE